MPTLIIQLRNLDAILAKLDELGGLKWIRGLLQAVASDVQAAVAKYPAATEANSPRGWHTFYGTRSHRVMNAWYERGYGPRWAREDGSIGGRQLSQTLGRRWTTQTTNTWTKIGNAATYAPYVHDRDDQAWFHRQRGWPTIQDEGGEAMEGLLNKVEAEVDRIWNG